MISKLKNFAYKLLRKSENYTKTDMVYLAKGGFWLTLNQVISSVASFLLAIAFANLLPKETYGIYKYILSFASILAIFTLSGMNTAIVQAVARGYEGSYSSGLKAKIRWGLLGGLAGLLVSFYYFWQGNNTLGIGFLITAVFIPFMDSLQIYTALLNAKKDFKGLAKYGVVTKIISSLATLVVLLTYNNIFLVILSYFAVNTTLRLCIHFIVLKTQKSNDAVDPSTITYGKYLSLLNVILTVAEQIENVLIFQFLGAVELALYSFAIAPPEQLKAVLKNMYALIFPKFSAKSKSEIMKSIDSKALKLTGAVAIMVIIYIILAPWFFQVLFPQYLNSIFLSQIYILSILPTSSLFYVAALEAHQAKRELLILRTSTNIISIVLMFVFIYFWGLMGIVIARVLSRLIHLIVAFVLVRSTSDSDLKALKAD